MVSNELPKDAYRTLQSLEFFSNKLEFKLELSYLQQKDTSPGSLVLSMVPSPNIVLRPSESVGISAEGNSLTLIHVPKGYPVGDWLLKNMLLVQIERDQEGLVVTNWLEGVLEYGTGATEVEAIADLISSMGDYLTCLSQQSDLGAECEKELQIINQLIERVPRAV